MFGGVSMLSYIKDDSNSGMQDLKHYKTGKQAHMNIFLIKVLSTPVHVPMGKFQDRCRLNKV